MNTKYNRGSNPRFEFEMKMARAPFINCRGLHEPLCSEEYFNHQVCEGSYASSRQPFVVYPKQMRAINGIWSIKSGSETRDI